MITLSLLLGRKGPYLQAQGDRAPLVHSVELSTPELRKQQAVKLLDAAAALIEEDQEDVFEDLHECMEHMGDETPDAHLVRCSDCTRQVPREDITTLREGFPVCIVCADRRAA